MSGTEKDSLSLESLFAFMDGLDRPAENSAAPTLEELPKNEEEANEVQPLEVDAETAPLEELLSEADILPDGKDGSSKQVADEEESELALLSIITQLPTHLILDKQDPASQPAVVCSRRVRSEDPRKAFRGKHAAPLTQVEDVSGTVSPEPAQPPEPVPTPSPQPTLSPQPSSIPEPITERESSASGEYSALDEARLSIDERLAKLIFERANQLSVSRTSDEARRSSSASATDSPSADEGATAVVPTPSPKPECKIEPTLAPKDVPVPELEGRVALPPEAEARTGCPPAESKIMFDEPPKSIGEGMMQADQEHRRGFTLKVAGGIAAGVLGISLIVFAANALSFLAEAPQGANVEQPDSLPAPLDNASEQGSSEPARNEAPPDQDLSGTVVYRYNASADADEARLTQETVTFDRSGLCETSSLEVECADEAAAQAYLDQLQRDFGASYQEGSLQGATALVSIDVAANKLNREAYEDALRVSVQDLSIVKKT